MPTVLVTRPRGHEGDEFYRILMGAGIDVVTIPMISHSLPGDLLEVDFSLRAAAEEEFDYLVFSSPTAVKFFERRSNDLGLMNEMRSHVRTAAIGETTAKALRDIGVSVSFPIPTEAGSEALTKIFATENISDKTFLLLQSQIGLDSVENALRELGAVPTRITLYLTEGPTAEDRDSLRSLIRTNPPELIAFFSPSAVKNTASIVSLPVQCQCAAIGDTTADAIRESFRIDPKIISPKPNRELFANEILRSLGLYERN